MHALLLPSRCPLAALSLLAPRRPTLANLHRACHVPVLIPRMSCAELSVARRCGRSLARLALAVPRAQQQLGRA